MRSLFVCLALTAAMPRIGAAADFDELIGWWHSPVEHAGQTSEIYLRFVVEDDKPAARLSMVAMDAWDVPVGTVSIEGDALDMSPYPFPLTYDRTRDTLSGHLPEAAVPVYRIPVTLTRTDPPQIPQPRRFDHPSPEIVWQHATGAPIWAGVALDPPTGLLVVANDAGAVQALERGSGKVAWQKSLAASIRARPAIEGKHVYLASDDGYVGKLNLHSGAEVWRRKVDAGGPPRIEIGQEGTRYDRYASAVSAHGDRLYVGGRDGALHALDAQTGRELWRFATRDIITSTPAVIGQLVLVASFDGNVYGIDSRTGTERWRQDVKGVVPGDLVVADDVVLAGSRSYDLFALDAATGKPRWQYYYWFSWIESPARIVGDTAYVGSSDALSLFAFDLANGRLKWQRKVPGWAWPRPAVHEDEVYVATIGIGPGTGRRQGAVTGIDRMTGEIRWVHRGRPIESAPQWGFAAAPEADADFVYAADLEGNVLALKRQH